MNNDENQRDVESMVARNALAFFVLVYVLGILAGVWLGVSIESRQWQHDCLYHGAHETENRSYTCVKESGPYIHPLT